MRYSYRRRLADGAEMRYRITPEEFKFVRLKANGPSMGLTLDGSINLRNARANLEGIFIQFIPEFYCW